MPRYAPPTHYATHAGTACLASNPNMPHVFHNAPTLSQHILQQTHLSFHECGWPPQGRPYRAGFAQFCDMPPGMQNSVEDAKAVLKEALKSPAALKANVAAMTALANILFQQKRFSEAHRYYCQVTLDSHQHRAVTEVGGCL